MRYTFKCMKSVAFFFNKIITYVFLLKGMVTMLNHRYSHGIKVSILFVLIYIMEILLF